MPNDTTTGAQGATAQRPSELADFDFAIGDWTYTTTLLRRPNGEPAWDEPAAPAGRWSFRHVLDGWVVQDEFIQPLGDGAVVRGATLRAFDAQSGSWRVRGVVAETPGWDEFEARRVEDTLVMTGCSSLTAARSGGGTLQRVTFYDFKPDSWIRRSEESLDGGKTWNEGVVFSYATRVETE